MEKRMQHTDRKLAEVFKDAKTSQAVANIIVKHLTNDTDIREEALNGLDLSACQNIIDLGCGFGFFSRAMKDKVPSGAHITGIDKHTQYKKPFLDSCKNAGLRCSFRDEGLEAFEQWRDKSADLIICSYALYFFPQVIPEIARILKDDGYFVTITHSKPHMQEFTAYVRRILLKEGIDPGELLPYEALIDQFSNINGMAKLRDGFCSVKQKPYKSSLVFEKDDLQDFVDYFDFKHSFFLPHNEVDLGKWKRIILEHVRSDLERTGRLSISKNDMIFVCSTPVH